MKKFMLLFFFVLCANDNFAQENEASLSNNDDLKSSETVDNDSLRQLYLYSSVGLFEYFSVGLGYQIIPEVSLTVKYSRTIINGGGFPGTGNGIGLSIKYYSNLGIFNHFALAFTNYLNSSKQYYDNEGKLKTNKGNYFEVTIGNDSSYSMVKNEFLFYWNIGVGVSLLEKTDILLLPTASFGIYYNLN